MSVAVKVEASATIAGKPVRRISRIQISNSVDHVGATCELTVVGLDRSRLTDVIQKEDISVGDGVEVSFGYRGLEHHRFIGFVTRVIFDGERVTLRCEDASYSLKRALLPNVLFMAGSEGKLGGGSVGGEQEEVFVAKDVLNVESVIKHLLGRSGVDVVELAEGVDSDVTKLQFTSVDLFSDNLYSFLQERVKLQLGVHVYLLYKPTDDGSLKERLVITTPHFDITNSIAFDNTAIPVFDTERNVETLDLKERRRNKVKARASGIDADGSHIMVYYSEDDSGRALSAVRKVSSAGETTTGDTALLSQEGSVVTADSVGTEGAPTTEEELLVLAKNKYLVENFEGLEGVMVGWLNPVAHVGSRCFLRDTENGGRRSGSYFIQRLDVSIDARMGGRQRVFLSKKKE